MEEHKQHPAQALNYPYPCAQTEDIFSLTKKKQIGKKYCYKLFFSITCVIFSAPYISLEFAHCPIRICFVFLSTRVRCSFYLCTLPISELSDFHFEENCDNKNTIANKLQANIGGSTEFLCEFSKYLRSSTNNT